MTVNQDYQINYIMKNNFINIIFFFIFLIGTLFSNELFSQTQVQGSIEGTWSGNIEVIGDIYVEEGKNLTIQEGTRVVFSGPYIMNVWGSVIASGTATSPIYFTVSDTSGFSDSATLAGSWQGIVYSHILSTTDSSIYKHVYFEYTKDLRDNGETSSGGAFTITGFPKVRLSNCHFLYTKSWSAGGAIAMKTGADIKIEFCSFDNAQLYDSLMGFGGALYAFESSPIVRHCIFTGNKAVWLGGALCFYYSQAIIQYNEYTQNHADIGGAISLVHSTPKIPLVNNLIYGNSATFFGGGMACNNDSKPVIVNNTIVNNMAAMGGGFYCNDSAMPKIYNSVITNNLSFGAGNQVYIWDIYSAPSFYYCNVEGGLSQFAGSGALGGYHGEYLNNLDTLNYFQIEPGFTFVPSATSPLHNAGTPDTTGLGLSGMDLAGNNRMVHNRIDIGAFERQTGIGIESIANAFEIFPNPVNDELTVKLRSAIKGPVVVNIYSLSGSLVSSGVVKATGSTFCITLAELTGGKISSGTYVISLNGAVNYSGKIIVN